MHIVMRWQFRTMAKWIPRILVSIMAWSATAAYCAAQREEKAPPTDSDWAFCYVMVILSIGLGIASVCRPGKRKVDVDD